MLWKKGWQARGIDFTFKKGVDFDLKKFWAGTPESFETYYGCKGDGNICDPANVSSFIEYVKEQTQYGAHLMMSDD